MQIRPLNDRLAVGPQIRPEDVPALKDAGFTYIINNRPDGEEPGQPEGATIEAAAQQAGIAYAAIPVTSAGFSEPQVAAMRELLEEANGTVLAYCRSGTRSTFLWSLAQASMGADPDQIVAAARGAGYDVSPVRPALDMFAAKAKG